MATFGVSDASYALDEGQYEAEIVSIEDAIRDPNKPSRFGDKPQLVITYQLLQDGTALEWEDGTPATKAQWVNKVASLTPQSTLYGLFSTLVNNGQPLDKERTYSTDELLHVRVLIFWGAYTGEDGTRKYKIQSVSPAKPKAATAGGLRRKPVEEPEIDPDKF